MSSFVNLFLFLKKFFDEFREQNIPIIEMSNLNEEGVMNVRNEACERLLAHRVEQKIKSSKINDVLNRLHVAEPQKRDSKVREPFIPAKVLAQRAGTAEMETERKKTERDLELELGRDYKIDLRSEWHIFLISLLLLLAKFRLGEYILLVLCPIAADFFFVQNMIEKLVFKFKKRVCTNFLCDC